MKSVSRIAVIAASALLLVGCSAGGADDPESVEAVSETASTTPEAETTTPEPLDLAGAWTQTNSRSDDTYQRATISDSQIRVDWIMEQDDSEALYWIGTFEAPTEAAETYSWVSQGDTDQMEKALLASGDSEKEFTYENGTLTYELTAMGVTMTVEMTLTDADANESDDNAGASADGSEGISVTESGLGVAGDYAWVTAMVEYDGLTGEFATVLFNVYDGDTLLASQEQVEELTTSGTTFPIGTQVEIPADATASRVEATVSVSDYGSDAEPMPVVDPVEAPATEPSFLISNTSSDDWADPRVAIVCRDGGDEIVGGGVDFPSLIPAGGEFLISDSTLIVDGSAETCSAYVQLALSA